MFSKRRRAASNPPQRATPSASASLAATKAFIRDRESNPNLSSAAAAAALRTHVTAPTPVGEIVTKRMVRRNSASSNGSAQPPGTLQRQLSSGSMSERSFRASSPGQGSPAGGNVPPVPAVPKDVPQTALVHRRASSLEPPYRAGSPLGRQGGRGHSLDRAPGNVPGRGPRAGSQLAHVPEDDTDSVTRSVNFSRPISPVAMTATAPLPTQASHGWFGGPVVNQDAITTMVPVPKPHTSAGVSAAEIHNAQHQVQRAADKPVKTHRASRGVEGARLSSGSMRAKPTGTAVQSRSFLPSSPQQSPQQVDPKSPDAIYDPSTRSFIHRQDAMARHRELHQEPEHPQQQYITQHIAEHPLHRAPQKKLEYRPMSPAHHSVDEYVSTPPQREEFALVRLNTATHSTTSQPKQKLLTFMPDDQQENTSRASHISEPIGNHSRASKLTNIDRNTETSISTIASDDLPRPASPQRSSNQDSPYPRLGTPTATTNERAIAKAPGSTHSSEDTHQSLSPPRSAHFSPVTVELTGTKHQPPPRSISPAKSALKSSNSVRGMSPVALDGRLLSHGAPSEASDTASEDGFRKKKKSVRVSFEETPMVASTPTQTVTAAPAKPLGLSASRWSPIAEKEDEFEHLMMPRPALPSFGSVRDRERRPSPEDSPEKVTETVSTSMSTSVGSIGEPVGVSSDLALSGIVSQDFAKKQAEAGSSLPVGSGATDETQSSHDGTMTDSDRLGQEAPVPDPKSLTILPEKSGTPSSISERVITVPDITLFPATPSPYEKPEPKFQNLAIPGGWEQDVTGEEVIAKSAKPTPATLPATSYTQPSDSEPAAAADDDSSDDHSSVYSDAYEDLSDGEGGFGSIDAVVESPVLAPKPGLMLSKYADKSSDQVPGSGLRHENLPSDLPDLQSSNDKDWDATREHWNGLNESRKQARDAEAAGAGLSHAEIVAARVMETPVSAEAPFTEQLALVNAPRDPLENSQPSRSPPSSQPSAKPLKSALKKSTARTDAAAEPHLRKTMRGPPPQAGASESRIRNTMRGGVDPTTRAEPQMRKSMRTADPSGPASSGLAVSRYSMPPTESKSPRGALQKRHIPATTVVPKQRPQSAYTPTLKSVATVPTYDSDSDASASSFQRTRARGKRDQGGRYTMRGSMRTGPTPTTRGPPPEPVPVRPSSPAVSPSPALRKSMRPSSPDLERPKSSRFSIRSLSPMGRFRNAKGAEFRPSSPPPAVPKLPASKPAKQGKAKSEPSKASFKSRFADSSDEEDDAPRRFQSRFADSDDDEPQYTLPPDLTPVRGIPRKAGEEDGDSTDLEEEADDESPKPAKGKEAASTINGSATQKNGTMNGQGSKLASGSLRDSKHAPALASFEAGEKAKSKRGFLGLGKKKSKAAATEKTPQSTPTSTRISSDIPMPPAPRDRSPKGPLTPIGEIDDPLTSSAEATPPVKPPTSSPPQAKRNTKLQRRSTPDWPLPSTTTATVTAGDRRPMSSDGSTQPKRPLFSKRHSSALSNVTAATAPPSSNSRAEGEGQDGAVLGRGGKKKKFGGLRRVFGLND